MSDQTENDKPTGKMTHDRYFCKNMDDKEIAAALIKMFLPRQSEELFQLDGLEPDTDKYLSNQGDQMTSDVVYRVPIEGGETYVSVLIEHKSQGALEKGLHLLLQVRYQEMRVIAKKYLETGRCPRVYIMGLYHGDGPYPGPYNVGELMDVPEEEVPDRWKEPLNILDLNGLKDEDLLQQGKFGIFLLALKHIYSENMMDVLQKAADALKKIDLAGAGKEFLVTLFNYLFERSKLKNQDELEQFAVELFTEETGGGIMSIADQIREKTRIVALKEGREEGIEKNQVETVRNMLAEGIDLKIIARVACMPIDRIKMIRDNT